MAKNDQLNYLNLAHNSFVGSIPEFFGNLNTDLLPEFPNLSFNQLTGSIPLSIASFFTKSQQFDVSNTLSNNLIEGPLPASIRKLDPAGIFAANTSLTGTVPSWLASLNSLTRLDISDNQLTGNLPASLMASRGGTLCPILSHNKLTGSLPTSIASLSHCFAGGNSDSYCSKGFLAGNQLSGTLPKSVGSATFDQLCVSLCVSHTYLYMRRIVVKHKDLARTSMLALCEHLA